MRKYLLSLGILSCIGGSVVAQDIHLSQYYASPLTLNPAQTGLTPRDYRVGVNYRTQNYSFSNNPYVTGVISYDMSILKGKLPEGDALGVGAVVFYDKAGSGALQNVTGGFSVAYHKSFGIEKQHALSVGVQGFVVNKSIHFNNLVFEDQLDPRMPAYIYPTAEELGNQDVNYPDFNAGLLYTGRLDPKSTIYAGASYFHLTSPEERFLATGVDSVNVKINPRYSFYFGGQTELNPNIALFGSALWQQQGAAREILIGGATGFILNPDHREEVGNTTLYLGLWYRFNDALVPYVGFEWTSFQLGFSYDVTVSNAANMTQNQSAYEVSLIYHGVFNKKTRQKYNFSCPKF